MQPHPTRRRRGTRPALAAAIAGTLLATSGCSGGHALADFGGIPQPTGADAQQEPEQAQLPTKATIRSVVGGRLDQRTREQVKAQVTATVDRWLDAAYLGGSYPRTDFDDAFTVFTASVREQAADDRRLLTNAGVGARVDAVRATRRRLVIDVLADGDQAAGVTARIRLGMRLSGGVDRVDRVVGDLYLTFQRGAWRVFGYDVKRGQV